jgi:hypothetical protein
MHSQYYAIALLDLNYLLTDDATSYGLAKVLRYLASVNLVRPHACLICVIAIAVAG